MNSLIKTWKFCGPGLLMAGAAIGVSHLVQSTRAGASFGWGLLVFILLANFFKYPFFEYGHRFATATGKSLLDGYKSLGRPYLWLFLILNCFTAITSIAAVVFVTAALLQSMLSSAISVTGWSALLIVFCFGLIFRGQYKLLDLFIKTMMIVLVISTLASFLLAASATGLSLESFQEIKNVNMGHLAFIIALMGWMPAPIEISVWQSLWIQEKEKTENCDLSVEQGKFDFNLGYGLTVFLAILFCGLGAMTMHNSAEGFSSSPVGFANQVIDLYSKNIGSWATPLIALTAFMTMFSTTLTLVDAYPRSVAQSLKLAISSIKMPFPKLHYLLIAVCGSIALLLINYFSTSIKAMVDWVTIIAFITAPIFAFLNHKLIFSGQLSKHDEPGLALRGLSYGGLVFLGGFALFFLWARFIS